MTIDSFNSKSNNLYLLKLISSLCVIYFHSFSLTGTNQSSYSFLIGQTAVCFFFFVSGFFVSKSLFSKNNSKEYLLSRIRSIFPLLFITIIITVFIVGPCVTKLSIKDYFMNKQTYLYLLNIVCFYQPSLPGVFINNVLSNVVNGSLWTLQLEFGCYLILLLVYKLGAFNSKARVLFLDLLECLITIIFYFPFVYAKLGNYETFLILINMFLIGVNYFYFRKRISINRNLFIFFLLIYILIFSVFFPNRLYFVFTTASNYILLPYILICIIFSNRQIKRNIRIFGEISYSIYLIGFIVQQILVESNVSLTPISNFVMTSCVSIIISFFLVKTVNFLKKIVIEIKLKHNMRNC